MILDLCRYRLKYWYLIGIENMLSGELYLEVLSKLLQAKWLSLLQLYRLLPHEGPPNL